MYRSSLRISHCIVRVTLWCLFDLLVKLIHEQNGKSFVLCYFRFSLCNCISNFSCWWCKFCWMCSFKYVVVCGFHHYVRFCSVLRNFKYALFLPCSLTKYLVSQFLKFHLALFYMFAKMYARCHMLSGNTHSIYRGFRLSPPATCTKSLTGFLSHLHLSISNIRFKQFLSSDIADWRDRMGAVGKGKQRFDCPEL